MRRFIGNKKCLGFSIIELSVVLSIIALIAISALAVGARKIEDKRAGVTKERLEHIMENLERFVANFNYLPCPAGISLDPDDANFGDGTGSGTAGPANCTAADGNAGATNVIFGGLPVRQLALSFDMAKDGWGRRFTYVVDEDLTWQLGSNPGDTGFLDPDVDGEIVVTNGAGGITMTSAGAVAVISHGGDGHGAWPGKGGTVLDKGCGTDVDEDENTAIAGAPCPGFNGTLVQKFRTGTFDDFVEYRVKWHF